VHQHTMERTILCSLHLESVNDSRVSDKCVGVSGASGSGESERPLWVGDKCVGVSGSGESECPSRVGDKCVGASDVPES